MALDLQVLKSQMELARPSFDQLNEANGGVLNFTNELEFAVQILDNNSYLAGSTIQSLQESLKNVALSGLSLNPVTKQAYLVPRKKDNKVTATLMPSYIGLIKILTDTGSVKGISATIVYEEEIDSLEIEEGIGGYARHKPIFDKKPGAIVACYAKAILADGTPFVALIRKWEWEEVRNRSESYKNYIYKKSKGEYAATPVWISDEAEMIRKTLIKNMWKYLPKSNKSIEERIGMVMQLDNDVNGIDFKKEQGKPNISKPKTVSIDLFDNESEDNRAEMSKLLDKYRDGTIPNSFVSKGNLEVNVKAMIDSLEEDFSSNNLHLEKFQKTSSYLEKLYSHYKSTIKPEDKNDGNS